MTDGKKLSEHQNLSLKVSCTISAAPTNDWRSAGSGLEEHFAKDLAARVEAAFQNVLIGEFAAAAHEFSQAIEVGDELRAMLEPSGQWTPEWRHVLALVYVNRGEAHSEQGAQAAAIADFGQAITLREDVRATVEPEERWRAEWHNYLAAAYSKRGFAHFGDYILYKPM